ncbi:ras guanine nucleotide exchange factor domain-containing protein [Halteromyces radiatus]|uniref:ras guanine nucleotide exchange factor domain-containing protein n=1 Tax=Halteromyces radiatus TaxID=101107 RepID=UPI00221EB4E6|nr:ras guanine nucleotide exchange factor domain-containing protein [Halteromyces radiatus]KAI8082811.1 ras guanine nucleotide exchange factor domain-containing protein [Halteromyces radiatus]
MTSIQTPHDAYMHAAQLLDEGRVKDAYLSFLSVVELSTKQLHGVKFVHHTVVSTPDLYEVSISMIRSSLSHLDDIVVKRSLPSSQHYDCPPPIPKTSIAPSPLNQDQLFHSKVLPCPPNDTSHNNKQKPAIPPKPRTLPPLAPSISSSTKIDSPIEMTSTTQLSTKSLWNSSSTNVRKNRGRGNSVSFAEDLETFITTPMRRNQSHPDILRPHTLADSRPFFHLKKEDTQRKSLDISHHHSSDFELTPMDVLADSLVDASILVPAQTNSGDNILTPCPSSSPTSDYIPLIPMPPLLSTHRLLQHQLTDLEASLQECKAKKRAMVLLTETRNNNLSMTRSNTQLEKEMDEKILQRNTSVAETRATLTKVRTLYMKAATVPNVMQFPPYLTAYQLTLIESAIFRNIPKDAFLTHSPRTPHARIVASTDFFNYTTRSIEHSILLPQEASRRAEMINRWIKIATKCLLLNNYQTLKAIVSALGTPPVQRLRRTWDCIPKKRMNRLELLNTLMSESDNYGRYREHMGLLESSSSSSTLLSKKQPCQRHYHHQWDKPIVPFLGVFIHDMTYLFAATKPGNQPENDVRVQDIMNSFTGFQQAPVYPSIPPNSYIKACQPKKHSFRPSASLITNALQRTSATVRQRSTHMALLFGASTSLTDDYDDDPRRELEVEQQLITQYLLMRPWVNEKIVDELSILREPPKQRSGSSPGSRAHSGSGTSGVSSYSSSIFSNASSLARMNSTTSKHGNRHSMADGEREDEHQGINFNNSLRQQQSMMMPISPTTTLTKGYHHLQHPLRTAHSFTTESSSSISTNISQHPTSNNDNTNDNNDNNKINENSSFSLVGHLRSLSLPTSEHPVTFRKRS